jgi:hypothetical protein
MMIHIKEWGERLSPPLSSKRARVMAREGRIPGATFYGQGRYGIWKVSDDTPDPRIKHRKAQ